jgi:striatin 1/3/4
LSSQLFDAPEFSSKQLTQPASQSVPPTKLAAIQAQAAASSQRDDAQSHKEDSSGSSPRSEGMFLFLK